MFLFCGNLKLTCHWIALCHYPHVQVSFICLVQCMTTKKVCLFHQFIYFLHIFVLVVFITRRYNLKASESCQQLFTFTSSFQPPAAPPPLWTQIRMIHLLREAHYRQRQCIKKGSFIHYFIYFLHFFVLVFLITRHYKASESCQQLFTLTSPFQPLSAPPPISPPSNSNKKDSSAPTSSLSPEGVAMDVITTDVQGEETSWDDRCYLPEKLTPGDLIGVNKDSYLVLDALPAEFDNHVKAMEVDERPTETYTNIGGLEKHRKYNRLYQLLNLFFQPTNIRICLCRSLVYLHSLDTVIKFSR